MLFGGWVMAGMDFSHNLPLITSFHPSVYTTQNCQHLLENVDLGITRSCWRLRGVLHDESSCEEMKSPGPMHIGIEVSVGTTVREKNSPDAPSRIETTEGKLNYLKLPWPMGHQSSSM